MRKRTSPATWYLGVRLQLRAYDYGDVVLGFTVFVVGLQQLGLRFGGVSDWD